MTSNDTTPYSRGVSQARASIAEDSQLQVLMDPQAPSDLILRFLIEFCSRAVHITEPVDGWIRRAGERCEEIGMKEVGRQLKLHAKHEAGHHLMLIEDARRLVERWNRTHLDELDAEALLSRPLTEPMQSYIQLHEDVIAGPRPFLQVAIEREIEGLSVEIGPSLVAQCKRVLGEEGMTDVHFLTEHVELDVGHTAFNEKLLATLLSTHRDAVDPAIETGSTVLGVYRAFLSDCVSAAVEGCHRRRSSTHTGRAQPDTSCA